ncbi:MAG: hypothetical protein K6F87_02770 [Lachnospiraceae bacterium]|nr:hypothetical protein [Lachnospiraceae bacterium]
MTRNFEDEYKKYAENNVPDLWGRIEAAIDEHEEKIAGDNTVKVVPVKKNNIVTFVSRHAGLLAACACVLLTIGALRLIGGSNKAAMSESAATAPEPAMAENASYDEAPAEYEAVSDAMADEPIAAAAAAEAPMAEEAEAPAYSAEPEASADSAVTLGEDKKKVSAYDAADAGKINSFKAEGTMEAPAEAEAVGFDMAESAEEAASTDSGEMIKCRIEDKSHLAKDHIIDITVTDALASGLDKDQKITLTMEDDVYENVRDIIGGDKDEEFTMIISPANDGKYALLSVEKK